MNKWTWLAMLAFVAVLGGSYYLLSRPMGKSGNEAVSRPEGEMDVEDFDSGDDAEGGDKGDNTYDMLEDPDAAPGPGAAHPDAKDGAATGTNGGSDVETIDDEDEAGEMVKDPALIDDDAGKVEPPKPGTAPTP